MKFTTLTPSEFAHFAETHPQFSFFQTEPLARYREKRGWQTHYVGLKDGKKIIAATMMLSKPAALGQKVFYAPRGPLVDYEDRQVLEIFFRNLKTYIKNHGGYIFRFDPYYEYRERDLNGDLVQNGFDRTAALENLKSLGAKIDPHPDQIKWLFALDLDKPLDDLKKAFRPNTRNLINKTLKTSIKIRELKRSELQDFYRMCSSTAKRKGFEHENKPLSYYEDFYDFFGKDIKYLMAELNLKDYQKILQREQQALEKTISDLEKSPVENRGRIKEAQATLDGLAKKLQKTAAIMREDGEKIQLSCAMFLLSGRKEIVYFIAGNAEKYLFLNAQYLIQWRIIEYAKKHHYTRYNFYGISGNFDKTDPAYGMFEFKKGFGGHVIELIGGFELPITKTYYLHKLKEKFAR